MDLVYLDLRVKLNFRLKLFDMMFEKFNVLIFCFVRSNSLLNVSSSLS